MIQITSAKIKKGATLEVKYSELVPKPDSEEMTWRAVTYESDLPIHPDLYHAFTDLLPYLVMICEVEDEKKSYSGNPDHLKTIIARLATGYAVKGISLSSKKSKEGLVITGIKMLSTGKKRQINLVTPFTTFDEMDYPGAEELEEKVKNLCDEIQEYVVNSKSGGNPQVEIEFPEMPYEDFKALVLKEAILHAGLFKKEITDEELQPLHERRLSPENACKELGGEQVEQD